MSAPSTNLLHGVGELLELDASTGVTHINDFLALGWILLRVGEGRQSFILGWLRERGESELPTWYEDQLRERDALLEALDQSALTSADSLEFELEPAENAPEAMDQ